MDDDHRFLNSQELEDERTLVFIAFLGFFPIVNCVFADDESEAVVRAHMRMELENAPIHVIMPTNRLVCVELDIEYVSSVKYGTLMMTKREYKKNALLFRASGVLELTTEEGRGHRRFVTPYGITINASERGNYIRFVKISCQSNCTIYHCFIEETGEIASFVMAKRNLPAGTILSVSEDDRENETNLHYACFCGEPGCVYDPNRENPLACHVDDCHRKNMPYKNAFSLDRHNNKYHLNIKAPRVPCRDECGLDFADGGGELRHHRHQHLCGNARLRHMHVCIGCDGEFQSRYDLGEHQTGARGCPGYLNYMENQRMQRPDQFRHYETSPRPSTGSDSTSSNSTPPVPTTRETRANTRKKMQEAMFPNAARIVRVPTTSATTQEAASSTRIVDDGEVPGSSSQRSAPPRKKQVQKKTSKSGLNDGSTDSQQKPSRTMRTRSQLEAAASEQVLPPLSSEEMLDLLSNTQSKSKKKTTKKGTDDKDNNSKGKGGRKDDDGAGGDSAGASRYNMRSRK